MAEKEAVLDVGHQLADELRSLGVSGVEVVARRGGVVRLVEDQKIPTTRVDVLAGLGQGLAEETQRSWALEVVNARYEPRKRRPRIDVQAACPTQVAQVLAIDDAKLETELVAHLIAPLDLKRCRHDDQDAPRAVAEGQFLGNEPSLDRLAQTDIVGDQQADARHAQGADERIELVVLDLDAAAERRKQRADVGARGDPPADGVKEGVETGRGVETGGLGEGEVLDRPGTRLDLPDDPQLFAGGVVLHGGERQEMLSDPVELAPLRPADDKPPATDLHQLPLEGCDSESGARLGSGKRHEAGT